MRDLADTVFLPGDEVFALVTTPNGWKPGVVVVQTGRKRQVYVRNADGFVDEFPRSWVRHIGNLAPVVMAKDGRPHLVVSLMPGGRFAVDYLRGDPVKTLSDWRNRGSRKDRIPVAAFPLENVPAFCERAGVAKVPGEYVLDECHANWIRRAPLADSWRRAVVAHVARFEGAARVLAQLTEA